MLSDKEFRAKQFLPFAALTGFEDTIKSIEKIGTDRKELSEDFKDKLNDKISKIKKGDSITVKYYSGIDYIETTGIVKFVDIVNKCICLLNSKILFEDIIDIVL